MGKAAHKLATFPLIDELFDEDGFLLDPEVWNEDLALHIADHDGIGPLNEQHWRVIRYLRERYMRVGGIPAMRHVCRATSINRQAAYDLFGGCREIWRLAGLPNPGEEAKAYF